MTGRSLGDRVYQAHQEAMKRGWYYQICPFCLTPYPPIVLAQHLNDDKSDHRPGATAKGWTDPATGVEFPWPKER